MELMDCPDGFDYDKCLLITFDDIEEYAGLDYVHNSVNVLEGKILNSDGSEDHDSKNHVSFTHHDDNTAYVSSSNFSQLQLSFCWPSIFCNYCTTTFKFAKV